MSVCRCRHTPNEHDDEGFCIVRSCDCGGFEEDEKSTVTEENTGPSELRSTGAKQASPKKEKTCPKKKNRNSP
jgi:hypothetical protein